MPLAYEIKRTESFGEIEIEALPNEWATKARVTVVVSNSYGHKSTPRIERIGWSTGARDWTLEDARVFFRAALEMLDAAEVEFNNAKKNKDVVA